MIGASVCRALAAALAGALLWATAVAAAPAEIVLAEVPLADQHGRPLMFRSQAVGRSVVVLAPIYSRCTTTCPLIMTVLADVLDSLRDRGLEGVRVIGLSLDPAVDTPAAMAAYGARFSPGAPWLLLTGGLGELEAVFNGLGTSLSGAGDHAAVIFVGDPVAQRWRRLFGMVEAEAVVAAVEELWRDRKGR